MGTAFSARGGTGKIYMASYTSAEPVKEYREDARGGRPWDLHHLGVVMNEDYIRDTGEPYIAQECETYGWNENGGMKIVGGVWENHCHGYRDVKETHEKAVD